jgi:ParB family chromosome partitioning protein
MHSIRVKIEGQNTKLAEHDGMFRNHPIIQDDYHEGSFFNINVSMISTDPDQPRKHFDPASLSELCESIKQKGVLQPVLIRKDVDNKIWIVAGERRYRAARMAGLERVPAILTKGIPHEIALIENLQREDLVPIEEAEALEKLAVDYRYTHEDLSQTIGKARSTITEILSLNKLPESIKSECRSANGCPRRLLVEIAKCETEEEMVLLFERAKKERFKSDHIRSLRKGRSDSLKESLAMTITNRARQLSISLSNLDMSTIDDGERQLLFDELIGLKEALDHMLKMSARRHIRQTRMTLPKQIRTIEST